MCNGTPFTVEKIWLQEGIELGGFPGKNGLYNVLLRICSSKLTIVRLVILPGFSFLAHKS